EEITILETLRRDVKDLALPVRDLAARLSVFRGRKMRVQRHRVDAYRVHLVVLILHQRNEWAYDKREARRQQGGELVDHRLAAARGHHDECVTPGEERVDWFPLARSEIWMTESLGQQGSGSGPFAGRSSLVCHAIRMQGRIHSAGVAMPGSFSQSRTSGVNSRPFAVGPALRRGI